jgi:hypothetical protein
VFSVQGALRLGFGFERATYPSRRSPFWGNALQSVHIAARATRQTVPASLSTVFFWSTRATIHVCEKKRVSVRVVFARADARPECCGGRGGCACMRRSVDPLLHVCLHVSAGVAQTDGPADS